MPTHDEGQRQLDDLCTGLDLHEPQWYIVHAAQDELVTFCRENDMVRVPHKEGRWSYPEERLRLRVARRLSVVIRAAVDAELVTFNK